MFSYAAYGLGIHSQLPLPELVVGKATKDITIRLDDAAEAPLPTGLVSFALIDHETICIRSKTAGTLWVRQGCEIVVQPAPGVDEALVRLFILGPALALLLYQRGAFVLHASAVEVAGGAVAFLGYSGWGKSTTAAALHARGHGVIADDVVAVQVDAEGRLMVWPAFPQLKLWPEVVNTLGGNPEDLPRLNQGFEKRARRVVEGFSPSPLPLRRLYVLAEGKAYGVELLPPREAIIDLVRHSYGTRLLSTQPGGAHFSRCSDLARRLPVHRLCRPRTLAGLTTLAQLVERDVTSNSSPPV